MIFSQARARAWSLPGQYFDNLGQASFIAAGLVAAVLVSVTYMFVLPEAKLSELMGVGTHRVRGEDGAGLEPGEAPGGRKRAFQEKCQVVAQEFGLTEREAEVMVLLAKGRTRARIQEKLYLSSGVVATHARHIYQKVGVHSK